MKIQIPTRFTRLRLTVPYTTGMEAACSIVHSSGMSHRRKESPITVFDKHLEFDIPITLLPLLVRPANSKPQTQSCKSEHWQHLYYNNIMPTKLFILVKQLYFKFIRFVTNFLEPRYTTFSPKSARKSIFMFLIIINNASEKFYFSLAFRPMTQCSEF